MRLSGVLQDSVVDGPGLRLVVFTQGCNHRCKGCHNQGTWAIDGGTDWSTEQLLAELDSNPLAKGVTISGGEPMLQAQQLIEFARAIKERGLELAIYSGFSFEEIIDDPGKLELLKHCDILIDGRFDQSQRSLELMFKGSKNQRTIDVKKSLALGKAELTTDARWI